jgi:hypothetical protein
MALLLGNTIASNLNPGSTIQNLSFNNGGGADNYVFVAVTHSNKTNNVQYNGVPMTLLGTTVFGTLVQRVAFWGLANPATGSNIIRVQYGSAQWSSTSIFAAAFSGCSGATGYLGNGGSSTPNSQSITIAANSMIYASGVSDNAQSLGYLIGGSTRTNLFSHNTNKQVEGAFSATGLSAGATNVTTRADANNITNVRVEIQEAGGTPPSTNTGNFLLCM